MLIKNIETRSIYLTIYDFIALVGTYCIASCFFNLFNIQAWRIRSYAEEAINEKSKFGTIHVFNFHLINLFYEINLGFLSCDHFSGNKELLERTAFSNILYEQSGIRIF